MRSRFLLPILLMSLAGAVPVSASPVDITDIIGQWQNAVGGPLTLSDNQAGQGVDRIRWGAHTGWSLEGSGYDFTPGANILGVTVGTPFVLGTFTHHNQTIPLGTEITAVQYAFQFQTNGLPGVLGTTLNFFHNETPNTPPPNCPPGTIGMLCADVVTMSAAFVGGPVTVGNEIYTFTLLGFSPDGLNFNSSYLSQELASNTTKLYALVSSKLVATPEPAALLLLGSGLAAAAAAARRMRTRRAARSATPIAAPTQD